MSLLKDNLKKIFSFAAIGAIGYGFFALALHNQDAEQEQQGFRPAPGLAAAWQRAEGLNWESLYHVMRNPDGSRPGYEPATP